jgi:hypothetical protein
LTYTINKTIGEWVFTPEYALNSNDGLPEDAWIPFLKEVKKGTTNTTRSDFRPFTVEEQKRILLVGACLQCHNDNSKLMQQGILNGLDMLLKKIDKDCVLPVWKE